MVPHITGPDVMVSFIIWHKHEVYQITLLLVKLIKLHVFVCW